MSRIVIYIDPRQDGGVSCSVAKAPYNLAGLHTAHDVVVDDLADLVGDDVLVRLGDGLRDRLSQNVMINEVIDRALGDNVAESIPIFFRVGDAKAHTLNWEAFRGNDQFLALQHWPIGRVPSGGDIPEEARREFTSPLKVAVVLSAVGRSGLDEWTGIHNAIQQARAQGLGISVTLLAAEDEVVDAAQAAQAAGDRDLAVEPVPATPTALVDRLAEIDPQLVHFYCHGSVESDVHILEIGTVNDWLRDDGTSSLHLIIDELAEALKGGNVWTVVLNTCRSAEAQVDTAQLALSHAERLVANGIPVAIGMRRLVNQTEASAFSGPFYRSAFEQIGDAVDGPDKHIEWADTLLRARQTLRDQARANGADPDSWTLPILFARTGSFELIEDGTIRAEGRRDIVAGLRDLLAESAPTRLTPDLEQLAGP